MIVDSKSKNITIDKVGGKGFSLIKLVQNKFAVPDFFIITTDGFEHFLRYNKLNTKINNCYKENDFQKIKSLILNGKFDEKFANSIYNFFDRLNTNLVSVRSSGTVEDSQDKSCAGQFKTFLNTDKDSLLNNIKQCFASFYSSNLKSYLGLKKVKGSMSVVVQKMINSEFSGVSFSTDFVEQNHNFCIIECVKGVGEKLVSGEVTPTKYFVRKNKNYIDYVVGQKQLDDKYIIELAKIAQHIEKIYQTPMDIEWCVYENKIYILQARPIVGKMSARVPYNYVMSRPRPLFMMQIVQDQSSKGLRWWFDNLYYLEPFHIFKNDRFEEYTNMYSIEQNPSCMINYIGLFKKGWNKKVKQSYKACQNINDMVKGTKQFDIDKFVANFTIFGANNTVANFLENTTNINKIEIPIDKKVKAQIIKNREFYDKVKYAADEYIIKLAEKIVSLDKREYLQYMTLDEVFKAKPVNINELKIRKKGFVYHEGKILLPKEFNKLCQTNGYIINLKENIQIDNKNTIRGNVAYPGVVSGKAKIIYKESDLDKVNTGDIIVSPMTVPTYIEAMKRAAAFVTDEGGTVCHAALIARELKKPCIVGTKCATIVLRDNMRIKVDADNGIVIISQKRGK